MRRMLVPDRLQEISARLDAATPGPWLNDREWHQVEFVEWPGSEYLKPYRGHVAAVGWPGNADLIAHAPADIAWLLNEVERLRKYAVHGHNDCWQSGKCVCGLEGGGA